jgi:alkylhydroperoxidase/carboxymuconolactone decarboxylase family protein YurZ
MAQRPVFMEKLDKHDPEFFELVKGVMKKAQGPGALDPKTKILIALALDAAGGHPGGVKNLAAAARVLGATEEEIIEVVRLAFLYSGIPGLVAGLAAYQA